jgi:hypothetical protein
MISRSLPELSAQSIAAAAVSRSLPFKLGDAVAFGRDGRITGHIRYGISSLPKADNALSVALMSLQAGCQILLHMYVFVNDKPERCSCQTRVLFALQPVQLSPIFK